MEFCNFFFLVTVAVVAVLLDYDEMRPFCRFYDWCFLIRWSIESNPNILHALRSARLYSNCEATFWSLRSRNRMAESTISRDYFIGHVLVWWLLVLLPRRKWSNIKRNGKKYEFIQQATRRWMNEIYMQYSINTKWPTIQWIIIIIMNIY